jgi:hypothetical protein
MTFHLLAGFLLPSLVFLYYLELRKKQYLQLLAAISAFAAIFGLAVVFFHYRGLPVGGLFLGSWASRSFQDRSLWIIPIFDNNTIYHWQQINLLFLMFPANLLIVPLIYYKRIKINYFNVHILIATVFMMIFQFTYRAQLGVYHDWNLFANAAVPFSILVWYNVLKIPNLKYKTEILIGLFSLSFLHSYCWILSNHFL